MVQIGISAVGLIRIPSEGCRSGNKNKTKEKVLNLNEGVCYCVLSGFGEKRVSFFLNSNILVTGRKRKEDF